jgi:hypothetical protein
MFEPVPKELTIAEMTNWRSIAPFDMETAWEMAIAIQKAEDATAGLVPGATKVDVGSYLLYVVERGYPVTLVEIPVKNINAESFRSVRKNIFWRNKLADREELLGRKVKSMKDFKKVPPLVIQSKPDNTYMTIDGQNRVNLAKKIDGNGSLSSFVLPDYREFTPVMQREATLKFRDELYRRSGKRVND